MINKLNNSNIPSISDLTAGREFKKPRLHAKLLPWQVTGLTDGEGGFYCSILQNQNNRFRVKLEFKVVQKTHSLGILLELQEFFSCGTVVIDNRQTDTKKYHVTALNDILEKIIPHFSNYPCLTSKFLNFKDWKEIANLMNNKEHLSMLTDTKGVSVSQGLQKIREISNNMNTKRNFIDKYNYLKSSLNLDVNGNINFKLPEHWLQTFIDGEGMFYNYLSKGKDKPNTNNNLETNNIILDSSLEIAQGNHDVLILLAIKHFFNGGYIKPKYDFNSVIECENSRTVNRFILRDTIKIIEFVDSYPMLTRKYLDYIDWKAIVNLKNNGEHKSPEGLDLIKQIKAKMNSKRD